MKSVKLCLAATALSLALPGAVHAQEWPLTPGEYVDVAGIKIDDGHSLEYANYLAGRYRQSLDYAVEQGWINSHEVLVNLYPRDGEANVYLLTRYDHPPTVEEAEMRDRAYRAYMQRTEAQLQQESGQRAEYRHTVSEQLLRKYNYRD